METSPEMLTPCAMRLKQSRWGNLKAKLGLGRYIGSGDESGNMTVRAEQKAAALLWMGSCGQPEQQVDQRLSDVNGHGICITMSAALIHDIVISHELLGARLDRALATAMPLLSRERVKHLISNGSVSLDGQVVRDPSTKARPGHYQIAVPAPVPHHAEAQSIPLDILFEDEHLLVVNKPAGLVVHPAAGNFDGTLVNALLHHCAGRLSGIGGVARPGIVHRIDKDTSGLLVVAKTDPAHDRLSRQFAAHSIHRRYLAFVAGVPQPTQGTIDAPLARSVQDRKKIAITNEGRGKRAVTHYAVIENYGRQAAMVKARLETGRTHQVRVHLASLGHPLLGDPVYGTGRPGRPLKPLLDSLTFRRQALHAAELGFVHPATQEAMKFEAILPPDMQQLQATLRDSF